MTTMHTLEATIDRDVYLITQLCQPELVAAVAELVRAGLTPAQVEAAMVAKLGVGPTTRHARRCAEYLVLVLAPHRGETSDTAEPAAQHQKVGTLTTIGE